MEMEVLISETGIVLINENGKHISLEIPDSNEYRLLEKFMEACAQ